MGDTNTHCTASIANKAKIHFVTNQPGYIITPQPELEWQASFSAPLERKVAVLVA